MSDRFTRAAALLLAVSVFTPAAARAQETHSATLLTTQHYLDWERVTDAQISPDGARIIYTREAVNKIEDRWDPAIWIVNADGSQNRFLVKGSAPRWAPDGKRLLYLADGEPRGPQLFVRWVDVDGPATQITRAADAPRYARWSPDGKTVAFTMSVPEKNEWPLSMPEAPKDAKWTPAPRMITSLHYRQDRVGQLENAYTHLFVAPADGGTERQLTSGQWHVGAGELRNPVVFDWTPDSASLVFQGFDDPKADLTIERSHLYVVDVASGRRRTLVDRAGYWDKPAVSPDGRSVAFVGYEPSGRTNTIGDLWIVGLDGNNMRNVSRAYDREPINLRWAPDSSGVYFDAEDRGSKNVQFAATVGGVKPVTTGTHMLTLDSVSRDVMAAGIASDPQRPADVVRYSLRQPGALVKLTDVNGDVLAGKKLAAVEPVSFASTGGVTAHGWIVKPPDFDASRRYPLILEIHGGPFSMYNVGFNYMFQNFAANGYVVLYTNPRGSTGYGSDFMNGIDHDYPGFDYDDLMAGVDAVVAKGYVDTTRMYVSGCSGGGVLSSWVTTRTNRFAAAAVRCPVSNWLSMAGQTDIPLFAYSFFRKPFWEDPSDWLAHSPLMHVGKVTTPTLLMTGSLDLRTPMAQTEEYYAALKVRGVPATLLQFNGEYHGTGSKPSNYIRTQLYMMSWFQRYTRAAGSSTN